MKAYPFDKGRPPFDLGLLPTANGLGLRPAAAGCGQIPYICLAGYNPSDNTLTTEDQTLVRLAFRAPRIGFLNARLSKTEASCPNRDKPSHTRFTMKVSDRWLAIMAFL